MKHLEVQGVVGSALESYITPQACNGTSLPVYYMVHVLKSLFEGFFTQEVKRAEEA
jgi:hypothetical protein